MIDNLPGVDIRSKDGWTPLSKLILPFHQFNKGVLTLASECGFKGTSASSFIPVNQTRS